MKRWKKTICMSVAVLVSCMVIGATAFAASITEIYPYNKVGEEYVVLASTTPKKAGVTMTWNTRPTSGRYGAMMWIAGSNDTSWRKTFPYQQDVEPLEVSMEKKVSYTSHIRAIKETVSGNATQVIKE